MGGVEPIEPPKSVPDQDATLLSERAVEEFDYPYPRTKNTVLSVVLLVHKALLTRQYRSDG